MFIKVPHTFYLLALDKYLFLLEKLDIFQNESAIVSIDTDVTNMAKVDAKIMEYVVKNQDGSYSCGMCGKNSGRKKDHAKNHVETHMEGLSFPCQSCHKTFRSRHSLATHKSRYHCS